MHMYTSQMKRGLSSGAGPLGWGAQCGAQKHSLGKPLTIIIFQFVVSPPAVMGLDYIVSLPLLRISFWFFFLPLVVDLFLIGFSLSHRWLSQGSCDFGVLQRGGALRAVLLPS